MSWYAEFRACISLEHELKSYTSFRIGGRAAVFAAPETREDLIRIYRAALRRNEPLRVLGGGYNLLVDLSTPPTFAIAATGSPSATVQFTIPNDATLCGALLYTQAAHAGTLPSFALANAQDLTLGW